MAAYRIVSSIIIINNKSNNNNILSTACACTFTADFNELFSSFIVDISDMKITAHTCV